MKYLLLCIALLTPVASYAGPFGLEMGMSIDDLKKKINLVQKDENIYSASSVPNPHPDFTIYSFLATPSHGLCRIRAIGKAIETSAYGTELINEFNKLESVLNKKYGASMRLDLLNKGSIWNEPRDWMIGMLKKERTLASYWSEEQKALPDNIGAIKLDSVAISNSNGFIVLDYDFTNIKACIKSQEAKGESAL